MNTNCQRGNGKKNPIHPSPPFELAIHFHFFKERLTNTEFMTHQSFENLTNKDFSIQLNEKEELKLKLSKVDVMPQEGQAAGRTRTLQGLW